MVHLEIGAALLAHLHEEVRVLVEVGGCLRANRWDTFAMTARMGLSLPWSYSTPTFRSSPGDGGIGGGAPFQVNVDDVTPPADAQTRYIIRKKQRKNNLVLSAANAALERSSLHATTRALSTRDG